MIKYNCVTGAADSNKRAREQRDTFCKPKLRGVKCKKCNIDTTINFVQTGSGYVREEIEACCTDFEKQISDKLWPDKN